MAFSWLKLPFSWLKLTFLSYLFASSILLACPGFALFKKFYIFSQILKKKESKILKAGKSFSLFANKF